MGIFMWRVFVPIAATRTYFTSQNMQHNTRGQRMKTRMTKQAVRRGV